MTEPPRLREIAIRGVEALERMAEALVGALEADDPLEEPEPAIERCSTFHKESFRPNGVEQIKAPEGTGWAPFAALALGDEAVLILWERIAPQQHCEDEHGSEEHGEGAGA